MSEGRIIESVDNNDLVVLKKNPKKFWKNVVVVYEKAFKNCEELKLVEIPKSVKIIGMEAFIGCKNLEMVILPRNIKLVEKDAFKGCPLNYISLMTNGEIILSKDKLDEKGVFTSQKLDVLRKVYRGFSINTILKEGHYKIFVAFYLASKLDKNNQVMNYEDIDKVIEEKNKNEILKAEVKR